MVEIIGVRFNTSGKAYYFDPGGRKLSVGTMVVVETARGTEAGVVSIPNRTVNEEDIKAPLKKIIRVAGEADKRQVEENKEREKEAFGIAVDLIKMHGLDMKLIDVEYAFDRSKILFYFTADGRVDFRELVKSLASTFKTRIELRQVGVRDEARQLGSIGICGRFLCCSTFLDDFRPVSIKMAKEQGLSLNPTKISGVCGRLMCCLQYEQSCYEEALKTMPQRGAYVDTPDGRGVVADTNTLKQQIRVKLDGTEGHKTETYSVGEFNIIGREPTVELDEVRKNREEKKVALQTDILEMQHDEELKQKTESRRAEQRTERANAKRSRNSRKKNRVKNDRSNGKENGKGNSKDNSKDIDKKNGGRSGGAKTAKPKNTRSGGKEKRGGYSRGNVEIKE